MEEQLVLIQNHHIGKINHRNIEETLQYLTKNYCWPNACEICQRTKHSRKKKLQFLPSIPFGISHVDVLYYKTKNYLNIADYFSKFAQAISVTGKTAINVCDTWTKYFTSFGIPHQIISDSGWKFNNEAVKALKLHTILSHFTTPGNHGFNGLIERLHATLIEHLRVLQQTHHKENNLIDYPIYCVIIIQLIQELILSQNSLAKGQLN